MLTDQDLVKIGMNPAVYRNLSESEKLAVDQVLEEYSKSGMSETLEALYNADYDETPVDFITFITDDQYLGRSTRNGQFLYPFWKQEDVKIFKAIDTENICEVALSGCLSGDTLIPLLNGTKVPIKELAESGVKNFKVYSYDLDTNRYTVGNAVKAFSTGYKMTYNVTFDNGETVRITGNHKFLTRDKHYKSINDGLNVGDSIMPFNYYLNEKGYEVLRHPQKDGTFIEEPTHRMVMRYKVGDFKGTVHHKNYKKRDNSPENLIKMTWKRHQHFHAVRGAERFKEFNEKLARGEVSEDTLRRIQEGRRKGSISRWSDPEQHQRASERTARNNLGNNYGSFISDEERSRKRKRQVEYNKTEHPRVLALNKISKEEIIDSAQKSFTRDQLADYLGISRCRLSTLLDKYETTPEVYFRKTPFNLPNRYWTSRLTIYNSILTREGVLNDEVVKKDPRKLPSVTSVVSKYFNGDYQAFYNIVKNFNHKIVSIKLNDVEQVYDIEVEKYHNFALDAGVVVHNSIGTGKTTNGVLLLSYHLYKTMCMKDPQAFFNLAPGSRITYAFLNNTLSSSYGVAYQTFQAFIQESPWFLKHGKVSGREYPEYIPEKGFGFVVGSRPQHTLGKHIIAAIMDEVSFAPGQNQSYEKSKIMDVYTNIRRRMESRFMVQGKNFGLMLLVSSKATESSFLEAYIADQVKKGYPIYVVDQPLWKVKPSAYSGKMFKVAVGSKYIQSRVVPDDLEGTALDEWVDSAKKQGLNVIDVPIEHRQAFDQDLDKALQDIAGISTSVVTKAFSIQKIEQCISDTLENPFTTDVVTMGMDDNLQLQDFFKPDLIPENALNAPIFIHLDASVSGDKTGLSGVAIVGTKEIIHYGQDIDVENVSEELVYQQVFTIGIQAPSSSEISFEKTRQFLYYLRDEVGLNIKIITTDGFQSVDTRQILRVKGFETGYTSLDRTPDGYDGLRSAINEQRIVLLKGCKLLLEELSELERDNMTRKYDHTAYSSKDSSDSLAGAYLDASKYKDEFMFFSPKDYDYENLNKNISPEEETKQNMISSLTKNGISQDKIESLFSDIPSPYSRYDDDILLL